MEQIKNGMLKLAKFISSGQMTIGRPEIGETTGESEFGKLLEQKNTEAKTEAAPERKDAADSTRETEQKPTDDARWSSTASRITAICSAVKYLLSSKSASRISPETIWCRSRPFESPVSW